MVAPSPPSPSVYRTRAFRNRQRVLYALAALCLVLVGYGIGRWQDTPAPAAAPLPSASAPQSPSVAPATTTPPPSPTVYRKLQAETADALNGIQTQDTEDEGGGQNVGWIANGDSLRFDDIDFGPVPATKVDVRVASESDDGRMDVRLDTPDATPIGTMRVTRTGGWQTWRTDEVTLTPVTGVHTVFLTFAKDGGDEFVNINWLQFGH
ncbi:carbohydrate-binding protein [Paractinoplanes globisporus]|uniref:Carbohydrate-binding protein n=1 Tax=Paractinoplanes globisporus TaxID=113565 RepID=A0ABW6WPF4_9ACTN|nr:carbohydrate-binding protein [Actinoplanes globisporus]